jgi:hypothetical protein
VNDSAKHIAVDSSADLRCQLEEWRVCSIEDRSVGCTVSIQLILAGMGTTHSPPSRRGDFFRFNSLDGLTRLGSVFGMLASDVCGIRL